MADEEVGNLPCPFAGQKRADRIHQTPAGTDEFDGDIEQAPLERDQPVEPLRRKPPTTLRVATPRAAA